MAYLLTRQLLPNGRLVGRIANPAGKVPYQKNYLVAETLEMTKLPQGNCVAYVD